MGAIRTEANSVYRDYVVPGNPASGANKPDKAEIRALFGTVEDSTGMGTAWQFLPVDSDDFVNAPVTVPALASRSGLSQNAALLARPLSAADYIDPSSGADCITEMQDFLLYAQRIGRAMKSLAYDNILPAWVDVEAPRGLYNFTCPLIIPENVRFQCRGQIIRGATSNVGPADYDGDTTSNTLNNLYQPTVIVVPHAAVGDIQIECHNTPYKGSGLMGGKVWTTTAAAKVDGGAGYIVNDLVTGNNPSAAPYTGFVIRVDAVNGSGAITAFTFISGGIYALPRVLQNQQWIVANGFGDFATGDPIFTVDGSETFNTQGDNGAGATFTVTWKGDYPSGFYDSGGPGILADISYGEIRVYGAGVTFDGTYGPIFGVQFSNSQHIWKHIVTEEGNVGVYFRSGSDGSGGPVNTVNPRDGVQIFSWGGLEAGPFIIDTPHFRPLQVDGGNGIKIWGVIGQNLLVNPAGQNSPPVQVGLSASNYDIDLDFDIQGAFILDAAINPALKIDNTTSSTIRINAHSDKGDGTPYLTGNRAQQWAQVGPGVTGSVGLYGLIDFAKGPLLIGIDPDCEFTGAVVATTLTVSAIAAGVVGIGACMSKGDVGTVILEQLTGPTGGLGTYRLSESFALASTDIESYDSKSAPGDCRIWDAAASGTAPYGLLMTGNRYEYTDLGAPGATYGEAKAGAGSRYTNVSPGGGDMYLNKGNIGVPDWRQVTTA